MPLLNRAAVLAVGLAALVHRERVGTRAPIAVALMFMGRAPTVDASGAAGSVGCRFTHQPF